MRLYLLPDGKWLALVQFYRHILPQNILTITRCRAILSNICSLILSCDYVAFHCWWWLGGKCEPGPFLFHRAQVVMCADWFVDRFIFGLSTFLKYLLVLVYWFLYYRLNNNNVYWNCSILYEFALQINGSSFLVGATSPWTSAWGCHVRIFPII